MNPKIVDTIKTIYHVLSDLNNEYNRLDKLIDTIEERMKIEISLHSRTKEGSTVWWCHEASSSKGSKELLGNIKKFAQERMMEIEKEFRAEVRALKNSLPKILVDY